MAVREKASLTKRVPYNSGRPSTPARPGVALNVPGMANPKNRAAEILSAIAAAGQPKPAMLPQDRLARVAPNTLTGDPRLNPRGYQAANTGLVSTPEQLAEQASTDLRNGGRPATPFAPPVASATPWAGQAQQGAGTPDPKGPTEGDRIKGFAMNTAMDQAPRAIEAGGQAAGIFSSAAPVLGNTAASASAAGGAALTGNLGAASTYGTAAATPVSAIASAMPWLGLAGQAYLYGKNGYDAAKGLTNSTASDDANSAIKAGLLATGPLAGWAAPLVDVVGFKSGKHKDQYQRDAIIKHLRDNKFIDEKNTIGLAGGGRFDLGDETISGLGTKNDKSYNINWEDPRVNEAVGAIQPLVDVLLGNSSEKRTSDLTGKLVNAALSSGDMSTDSIRGFYEQAGFDREKAAAAINELAKDAERLDPARRDAYLAAIDKLFPSAQASTPSTASTSSSSGQGRGNSKPKTKPAITPPVAAPIPTGPAAPGGAPVDYGQAIVDVYKNNTSNPITAGLNPVTQPPFSLNPLARRR